MSMSGGAAAPAAPNMEEKGPPRDDHDKQFNLLWIQLLKAIYAFEIKAEQEEKTGEQKEENEEEKHKKFLTSLAEDETCQNILDQLRKIDTARTTAYLGGDSSSPEFFSAWKNYHKAGLKKPAKYYPLFTPYEAEPHKRKEDRFDVLWKEYLKLQSQLERPEISFWKRVARFFNLYFASKTLLAELKSIDKKRTLTLLTEKEKSEKFDVLWIDLLHATTYEEREKIYNKLTRIDAERTSHYLEANMDRLKIVKEFKKRRQSFLDIIKNRIAHTIHITVYDMFVSDTADASERKISLFKKILFGAPFAIFAFIQHGFQLLELLPVAKPYFRIASRGAAVLGDSRGIIKEHKKTHTISYLTHATLLFSNIFCLFICLKIAALAPIAFPIILLLNELATLARYGHIAYSEHQNKNAKPAEVYQAKKHLVLEVLSLVSCVCFALSFVFPPVGLISLILGPAVTLVRTGDILKIYYDQMVENAKVYVLQYKALEETTRILPSDLKLSHTLINQSLSAVAPSANSSAAAPAAEPTHTPSCWSAPCRLFTSLIKNPFAQAPASNPEKNRSLDH